MAQVQPPTEPAVKPVQPSSKQPRGPSIHQIYALPVPIKIFPLPIFYPNNPVSLFHVLWAWLGQVLRPPPTQPAEIHHGVWSPETCSVHILDEASTRALWEQGFFGKGSLSRSEPNWLKREQVRRGQQEAHVSELATVQRREERMRTKWERARLEQEAIRQTRLEEARLAEARRNASAARKPSPSPSSSPSPPPAIFTGMNIVAPSQESPSDDVYRAPVCPASLLALPNSMASRPKKTKANHLVLDLVGLAPVTPANLLALPNSLETLVNGNCDPDTPLPSIKDDPFTPQNVSDTNNEDVPLPRRSASPTPSTVGTRTTGRRKSVRFSPTIESTTFQLTDPPSPSFAPKGMTLEPNGNPVDFGSPLLSKNDAANSIIDKEHLQITPEETFFLAFALGALRVTDPHTGKELSVTDLFTLFRQYSYFPPSLGPEGPELQPDDNFLVHYSVYHHFRSLGWVPRSGIKFGVDWLLYARGPVFDHAEFGLVVIPSYSDSHWKQLGKKNPEKTWQWLHGTVRVLSHVTKSLVLVYVDVPSPRKFEQALEQGFSEVFKLYTVREVTVKRWSANRNR